MRLIERKVYKKLNEKSFSLYEVEEIIDSLPPKILKKSYPDDCLFQKPKYFAKNVIKSLLRYKLIERKGNKYKKVKLKNKGE